MHLTRLLQSFPAHVRNLCTVWHGMQQVGN